jgi:hypothetical protein
MKPFGRSDIYMGSVHLDVNTGRTNENWESSMNSSGPKRIKINRKFTDFLIVD